MAFRINRSVSHLSQITFTGSTGKSKLYQLFTYTKKNGTDPRN